MIRSGSRTSLFATYRPMLRLLSEDDYKFFASQPGITPTAIEQFRRERRRVFRSYLRSLVKDFHRLHLAARMTLVYSQQDRPELAQILFRQRAVFTWAVLLVEFGLVIHTFGLRPVDRWELLGALDAMRLNVSAIAPAASNRKLLILLFFNPVRGAGFAALTGLPYFFRLFQVQKFLLRHLKLRRMYTPAAPLMFHRIA